MEQIVNDLKELLKSPDETSRLVITYTQNAEKRKICVRWVLGNDGLWYPIKYPCADDEQPQT